jgi:hypothetical protein
VRQRADGDDAVGLALFAFKKPLRQGFVTHREVGGFGKCPGQVLGELDRPFKR